MYWKPYHGHLFNGFPNISTFFPDNKVGYPTLLSYTLHPEKLASKKFGYLACDR